MQRVILPASRNLKRVGTFQQVRSFSSRAVSEVTWKPAAATAALASVVGAFAWYTLDPVSTAENSRVAHAESSVSWMERQRLATKRKQKTHECSKNNKFMDGCSELKIFSGNAHPVLGEEIALLLGQQVGSANVGRFADGEVSVKLLENVRGTDAYVIQPTCPNTNENVMELLLMVSALRHASAKRVTAIIPYYGYLRSAGMTPKTTSSFRGRTSSRDNGPDMIRTSNLAASDIANMLEVIGTDRVVTVDLQPIGQGNAEGFFNNATVDNIATTEDEFVKAVSESLDFSSLDKEKELVVLSPHTACLTKAQIYRSKLAMLHPDIKNIAVATIIRTPSEDPSNPKRAVELVGNVKGKNVLIVEDLVDRGSTTLRAVKKAKEMGADRIFAFSSHALLNGEACTMLQNSDLEKMVVLDSVPVSEEKRAKFRKLEIIKLAPVLARLIQELHFQEKIVDRDT